MKIVINNFFSGVLKRGIPIYTSELVSKLREDGVEVIELTCPPSFYKLPSWILNILFIFVDQLLTPLTGMAVRSKLNIYPYNSSSLIDMLTGKGVVIIHDFISLKRNKKNLAALYVKFCIFFASKFAKKVILISQSTARVAKKLALFNKAQKIILPNPFFSFEKVVSRLPKNDDGYMLLVSGLGENKDLDTALNYYFSIPDDKRIPLKILGCGNGIDRVLNKIGQRDPHKAIEIIRFIPLTDVAKLYCNSKIIWAHSLAEGYGRTLAESKLSCKNVLCTRISAFREQVAENIYYYSDIKEFYNKYVFLVNAMPHVEQKPLEEHVRFESELRKLYE